MEKRIEMLRAGGCARKMAEKDRVERRKTIAAFLWVCAMAAALAAPMGGRYASTAVHDSTSVIGDLAIAE